MARSTSRLLVAALVLAQGCSGCADDGTPGPDAAGTSTSTNGSTTSTLTGGSTSTTTTGMGGGTPTPCPDWPGWENWDDFAPDCSLCVPSSADALPPPIEWEPCDPKAGFASGCRRMKADWPWTFSPFAFTASVDVGADGKPLLAITRVPIVEPKVWRIALVAEADGKVRSAMLDHQPANSMGCTFELEPTRGLRQGLHAFSIVDGDIDSDFPEAAVGGPVDALHPTVLQVWPSSGGHGYAASSKVWATWGGGIGATKWGEPWKLVATPSLDLILAAAWDDFVWWDANDGYYAGIQAWTPAKGTYDFITFPGDATQGVFALGTDGVHMVWMQGAGKGTGFLEPYPDRSVMASAYTTDPASLVPVRLRSFPSPKYPLESWVVGCGYAGIRADDNLALVVRLSDGWSWPLSAPQNNVGFNLGTVYALTCDEIFVQAGAGDFNIARVKLDVLGPGIPPD